MFINETGLMNILFTHATLYITGSVQMTLISVLILMIFIGLMFRLPLELILLICVPLVITFMAYDSSLIAFGGIILLILGGILALSWFFFTK